MDQSIFPNTANMRKKVNPKLHRKTLARGARSYATQLAKGFDKHAPSGQQSCTYTYTYTHIYGYIWIYITMPGSVTSKENHGVCDRMGVKLRSEHMQENGAIGAHLAAVCVRAALLWHKNATNLMKSRSFVLTDGQLIAGSTANEKRQNDKRQGKEMLYRDTK